MAVHTLNTTAAQEALLQRLADEHNAAQTPPTALTADDYLKQVIFVPLFQKYCKQFDRLDSEPVRAAWEAAEGATRKAVNTTLGL